MPAPQLPQDEASRLRHAIRNIATIAQLALDLYATPEALRVALQDIVDSARKAHWQMTRQRDADGRYSIGKLDRRCTCGHVLGDHTAARDAKAKSQPCLEDGCNCDFFVARKE